MNMVFLDNLHKILLPEHIQLDESMSRHTTFRIGGPADYFTKPQSIEELKQIILLCREHNISYKVIGNGSNLLFSDKGCRGMVIKNETGGDLIIEQAGGSKNACKVTAASGILLSKFANELARRGLTGYEFASGIPGTLGGAVVMNAGAYGGEIGDYIQSVDVLDGNGNVLTLNKEELAFSYRHSIVKEAGYIVLQAVFIVNQGISSEIYAKMEEYNKARKEKQPLEYPSAGSAFKRPAGNYAGKLIMEAGLRGLSAGGAKVSEKHCGFIINTGGATAEDVLSLLQKVKEAVKEHSGYELETEIETAGDFS